MPTDRQKTVAGLLLLGASTLTGSALLAAASQGVGANWTSEGLMGLWSLRGRPLTPGAAVIRAGERAILQAVDILEQAYQHEDRDTRAFVLIRECAPAVATAQYPIEVSNLVAIQHVLATNLDMLLYGHEARQFLEDRLLDTVTVAFREALSANEQAWRLFHGWILEQLSVQNTSLLQHLDRVPEILALIQDQATATQALTASMQPLQRLLAELRTVQSNQAAASETTFKNSDINVEGDFEQAGESIYIGNSSHPQPPPPKSRGSMRFENDGIRVKGDFHQAGGNIYKNSTHAQTDGIAVVINQNHPPVGNSLSESQSPITTNEPQILALTFHCTLIGVQVYWQHVAIGSVTSSFSMPYLSEDLALVIRMLDALQFTNTYPQKLLSADERQRLVRYGLADTSSIVFSDAPKRVGRALFKALNADQQGAQALFTVRNHAAASGVALALHLHFPPDAIDLATLPWELLWDNEPAPLLYSRGARHSCIRHVDIPHAIPPAQRGVAPLRILAISPEAGINNDVHTVEREARMHALQPLITQCAVQMHEIRPATRTAITDAILAFDPHVIHYYGHGKYNADSNGSLLLDTAEGGSHWTPVERLVALLGGARLLVIHACQGAMVSAANEHGLRSGIAPALSAEGVPLVIGMQLAVRITAATRFSYVLYDALAKGSSIQEAVSRGRQALYVEDDDQASWYVPVLYIRSRETGPVYL